MNDRDVLGFAGSCRRNCAETSALRGLESVSHFRNRPGLIGLQEHRVAGILLSRTDNTLGIRNQEIVSDHLYAAAHRGGEGLHPWKIIFRKGVLHREDR